MSYSDIKNGRERESYRENMKSLSLLAFFRDATSYHYDAASLLSHNVTSLYHTQLTV